MNRRQVVVLWVGLTLAIWMLVSWLASEEGSRSIMTGSSFRVLQKPVWAPVPQGMFNVLAVISLTGCGIYLLRSPKP